MVMNWGCCMIGFTTLLFFDLELFPKIVPVPPKKNTFPKCFPLKPKWGCSKMGTIGLSIIKHHNTSSLGCPPHFSKARTLFGADRPQGAAGASSKRSSDSGISARCWAVVTIKSRGESRNTQ
jgi:hypothetical protein